MDGHPALRYAKLADPQARFHELAFVAKEGGLVIPMKYDLMQVPAGSHHTLCSPVQQEGNLAEDPRRQACWLASRSEMNGKRSQKSKESVKRQATIEKGADGVAPPGSN